MSHSTLPVRHLTISIAADPREVYAYASDPANLPEWAAGLSGGIEHRGGEWIVDSPMGRAAVEFAEANDHGILDHLVILESGERVLNPVRVLRNGEGAEVVFTLFQLPGVDAEAFKADAVAVEKDLATLKGLLEA